MSKKIDYLKEVYKINKDNNIFLEMERLELLTKVLFDITQSLSDYKETPLYHLTEIEGKYFRFGLANQSIINLIKGNNFKLLNKDILLTDIFSLKCITRMQIESFLLMFYLFFDDISNEVKSFRYNIYKLHGLQKQLGFEINFTSPFIEEQKLRIKREIEEVIKKIEISSNFIKASQKEKVNLLKPRHPKFLKSKELFQLSGISNLWYDQVWQLFSNYAHSEHISDRQFNAAYSPTKNAKKQRNEDCLMIIKINIILTSILILNITKIYNCAKITFDNLSSKDKFLIQFYVNLVDKNNRDVE